MQDRPYLLCISRSAASLRSAPFAVGAGRQVGKVLPVQSLLLLLTPTYSLTLASCTVQSKGSKFFVHHLAASPVPG
eukprot:scaffold36044_cov50-Phaeocystis_antarctica.AAC.3